MYYILYNPSIIDDKSKKKIDKLFQKLSGIDECYKLNLFEINGKEIVFLKSLNEDDVIYLCGGDGTLNHFINNVGKEIFKCKILYYALGSRSDFKKDFKNDTFIDLKPIVEFMPSFYINGEEKHYFLNGVGVGLDAVLCRSKMQQRITGYKRTNIRIMASTIKKFRTYSLDIEVDDEKYHYDNVWFMSCCNGKYTGGLKVAPEAIRDDGMFDLIIVHDIPRWKLFLISPFTGFKFLKKIKGVEYVNCRKVRAIPDGCTILQKDGETLDYAREIRIEC